MITQMFLSPKDTGGGWTCTDSHSAATVITTAQSKQYDCKSDSQI